MSDFVKFNGRTLKLSAIKNPLLRSLIEQKSQEDAGFCHWSNGWPNWNNWNQWRQGWRQWHQWGQGRRY